MEKIDFTKTLDGYRASRGRFQVLEIPEMRYLMVDGHGDPNSDPAYAAALEALYPVAYKLKFLSKRELGRDYVVPPLEGLWWADDMEAFTAARDKSRWDWTMMLMVPGWVGQELFELAVAQAGATGAPARLDDLRFAALAEGLCVQTLHVGPFDDEGPVLERMHREFIPEHGLRLTGTHHEIYLSDARRTAPERLRTILRQPVADAGSKEEGAGSGL
ncbi:MAG: GyrI-like domain-containing protein [Leucobacter sp.]